MDINNQYSTYYTDCFYTEANQVQIITNTDVNNNISESNLSDSNIINKLKTKFFSRSINHNLPNNQFVFHISKIEDETQLALELNNKFTNISYNYCVAEIFRIDAIYRTDGYILSPMCKIFSLLDKKRTRQLTIIMNNKAIQQQKANYSWLIDNINHKLVVSKIILEIFNSATDDMNFILGLELILKNHLYHHLLIKAILISAINNNVKILEFLLAQTACLPYPLIYYISSKNHDLMFNKIKLFNIFMQTLNTKIITMLLNSGFKIQDNLFNILDNCQTADTLQAIIANNIKKNIFAEKNNILTMNHMIYKNKIAHALLLLAYSKTTITEGNLNNLFSTQITRKNKHFIYRQIPTLLLAFYTNNFELAEILLASGVTRFNINLVNKIKNHIQKYLVITNYDIIKIESMLHNPPNLAQTSSVALAKYLIKSGYNLEQAKKYVSTKLPVLSQQMNSIVHLYFLNLIY